MRISTFLAAAAVLIACEASSTHSTEAAAAPPQHEAAAAVAAEGTLAAVPDVAERVVRSVVNIATTRVRRLDPSAHLGPFWSDPFFREFFFGPYGPTIPRERRERSLGSGVIVDRDGTILTNNHVVGGADEIEVTLHDGRSFEAKVVGTDERSDLAVVRIVDPPDDLVPLPFGDSEALRLGETVLAVGDPFGIGQTVTMGIVSAKGRANLGIVDYEDFIQTDAAINPGNSGGALVNLKGELVGINTAIVSRSGGYQGIGFAIPSNMAKGIMRQLLDKGHVERGYLGIVIQDLDEDLRDALGVDVDAGVLVGDVQPGSAADDAGFRRGDVVVEFNGEPMRSAQELRFAVAAAGAGSRFEAVVVRDGERVTLTGRLGRLDDEDEASVGPGGGAREVRGPEALEGIEVRPLDDAARAHLEVPDDVDGGLVVTSVESGSPAARAGLREGDVILEVNRKPVRTVRELERAARGGRKVLLLVLRRGSTIFMVLGR